MRSLLVIALCLTGCSTSRPALPEQPNAPTDTAIVQAVGKDWDKIDQKVAASVAIARENAEKPEVVRSETTVALSFLPAPSPEELALARQRAAKADQKDYADAVAFGKKLLAKIDADWAKVEAANTEALRVSQLKDARIAELTKAVEQAKKDAAANMWTLAGIAVAVLGAAAMVFTGPRIGGTLLACGAAIGAFPVIADSEYFSLTVITAIGLALCLGLWYLYDRIKDANDAPYEPPQK